MEKFEEGRKSLRVDTRWRRGLLNCAEATLWSSCSGEAAESDVAISLSRKHRSYSTQEQQYASECLHE